MSRDINPFGLRMPVELREQITTAAKTNGRSMNSEIVARLTASFETAGDIALLDQLTAPQKAALRLVLEKVLSTG